MVLDNHNKRRRSLTFDDLPLDLQLSIMWLVATSSVRNCRLVLELSKKFKDLTKRPEFFRDCKFPEIPRYPWRAPNSYENDFLYECRKANNPEIFWRDLVVDLFQYRNFRRIDEHLAMVKGHPHFPYCECIIKLLSPHEHHRVEGLKKMVAIRSTRVGLRNLAIWRLDLCKRVQELGLGYLWQHGEVLSLYCVHHDIPNWFERDSITCEGCMGNFEAQIFYDPSYLSTVINTRI